DDSGLDLEPRWETEPSIEAIRTVCLQKLDIHAPDDCAIYFLAAGAFNKLYLVEISHKQKYVMRVSLPVDPQHKTSGEVATLRWINRCTKVPVPDVIAFDDSSDNEIGFEWILMRLMPGSSAHSKWRKMSMATKKALVEQLAEYQAQLFRLDCGGRAAGFRGIGTLNEIPNKQESSQTDPDPVPGRIVSHTFFWGQHFDYDIPRGPFRSSHDWLDSYLRIIIQEQKDAIQRTEDEEDGEYAERILRTAERLSALLPKLFPSILNPPQQTVLWHDDLSLSNILVDDKGRITALVDWECVSTMPRWAATQMPKFLMGPERQEEPVRDNYMDEILEEAEERDDDDDQDNEEKNGLYWIHLMEYEQTLLTKTYADRMRLLWPEWDAHVADAMLSIDFLGAIDRCASGFNLKSINGWIDAIEKGEFPGLETLLNPKGATV
ncbi:phosphotransferase enzyme family-domain-containing protein, partial [Ilyonectria robusta]|uniref:phosphotransferase enzyme family-domain-containing protein n=1 Tax=Ilyonectria robusta TaxID=1079257 RepID=UPI001E8D6867